LTRQLFRSAASVAVNYRATGRARSRLEFIAKLSIVVEEADETVFWLELIKDSGISTGPDLDAITKEAKELLYIFTASRKTAKENTKD
jgi:four helix bundle protein